MAAALAYVLNERTLCWRTQTPGVAAAGDSTISAWCYSPRRKSVTWSQDGASGTQADVYQNETDDDLATPIPGAVLQTYPLAPGGDVTAAKRFHEIVATFSLVGTASAAPTFTYGFGADAGGGLAVAARALPGNPVTAAPATPQFFQSRVMVPRNYHIGQSLIVQLSSPAASIGPWRLHAIEPVAEPVSSRSINR